MMNTLEAMVIGAAPNGLAAAMALRTARIEAAALDSPGIEDGRGTNTHDAIVIGAGPGGLAAAAALRTAGIEPVVLERSAAVGSRWRGYYDRLTLQSPRWLTSLPGYRIPREFGRWPDREGFVAYLERYADRHQLDVRHGVTAHRVDRSGAAWSVTTDHGHWHAPYVVVATGYNNVPYIPAWPGLDGFTGQVIHAADFRNGEPYRGRDVLVVGAGNSGSEIALFASRDGAARVRLAVRTPPHVAPRQVLGFPSLLGAVLMRRLPAKAGDIVLGGLARMVIGDLTRHGMPAPREGISSKYQRTKVTPILDTGIVGAIRSGAVEIVSAVEAFDRGAVTLADGERISPDVVIAATGYRRGLERMVGHLGVLDPHGDPVAHGARSVPGAPGLHFIGYVHPFSGNIREIAIHARKIARAAAKDMAARNRGQAAELDTQRETEPSQATVAA
jgi:putative flavoprotein involved in K+ transport